MKKRFLIAAFTLASFSSAFGGVDTDSVIDVPANVESSESDDFDFRSAGHARDELDLVISDATGGAIPAPSLADTNHPVEYPSLGLQPTKTIDIEDLPLQTSTDAIVSVPAIEK